MWGVLMGAKCCGMMVCRLAAPRLEGIAVICELGTQNMKKLLSATACVFILAGCAVMQQQPDIIDAPETEEISQSDTSETKTALAPLFDNMGDFHREVTTDSPDAQAYFDQGMVLAFGFNHAEAIRSFKAAQALDPQCAMCFWGEALATGPNINVTSKGKAVMSDTDRVSAREAIDMAIALKGTASADEAALIDALAARYNG